MEPTLEREIRKGQLNDEKIKDIAEHIVMGKAWDSTWMIKERCCLVKGFVC